MQTRSSDEKAARLSIRPSVRPSVKRVDCDKTEENFGSTVPPWSEVADFQPIFARSASAVTHSEKVQLTLIGSPLRAFQ